MIDGFEIVERGSDHIKVNKVCQDYAAVENREYYSIAVVSDGHGSDRYIRSDVGSRYAVESMIATIDAFMEDGEAFLHAMEQDKNYVFGKMQEQFLARWTKAVEEYHKDHPLTDKENEILANTKSTDRHMWSYYGATIRVAVMSETYHYGMLIGDGGFVVLNADGTGVIPLDDPYACGNYTSSICSSNSIQGFVAYYKAGKPLLMAVATDGLEKTMLSEDEMICYHAVLGKTILNQENPREKIQNNIKKRSEYGGDDTSIAIIYDLEGLKAAESLLDTMLAKHREEKLEQQRLEEAQREQYLKEQEQIREQNERFAREQEMLERKRFMEREEQSKRELEELKRQLAEKEKELNKKDRQISEKDKQLDEQRRQLAENASPQKNPMPQKSPNPTPSDVSPEQVKKWKEEEAQRKRDNERMEREEEANRYRIRKEPNGIEFENFLVMPFVEFPWSNADYTDPYRIFDRRKEKPKPKKYYRDWDDIFK